MVPPTSVADQDPQIPPLKPYGLPALVRYGNLRTLTQTGSMGGSEAASGSMCTPDRIVMVGECGF